MLSKRHIRTKLLKKCGSNYEKLWYLVFFDGSSMGVFKSRGTAKNALEQMFSITYTATQTLVFTSRMVFNPHSKVRLYTVVSGAEIVNYLHKVADDEKGLEIVYVTK